MECPLSSLRAVAKQSMKRRAGAELDCFVAVLLAMTIIGVKS